MNRYDVIVIGVGSMGSASCYYLSKRGYKVLGLEQFDISHEQGSHTGQSRIVRKAYFEHSDYVPLMERAYQNWRSLEEETGMQIYYRTGLVYYGKPDHELIKGVKQSASLYNIPLDDTKAFTQFTIPAGFEKVFEPDAGFVSPEKTIQLYTKLAIENGAKIGNHEKVLDWKKEGSHIKVTTDKNIYHSDKLIITSGAWTGKMIPNLHKTIKVTRQFIAWIKPKNGKDFSLGNFPCWMIADELKSGLYYGFPMLPEKDFGTPVGLKLARHYPATVTDPDKVNRETTEEDKADVLYVLNKYFPGVFNGFVATKTCLYANSPDENFIIDYLPGYDKQVAVACGFSGHGFKFVPVIGEIMADLMEGNTKFPIEFLSLKRPALA